MFPAEAKEKLQIEGNVFAFAAPGAAAIRASSLTINREAKLLQRARRIFRKK